MQWKFPPNYGSYANRSGIMPIMKWLKTAEERFPWTLIGVLAAIAFGVVGLYSVFHESKPDISFEIVSEVNVLDVRKPLKDLAISFRGEDIQEKNLNLRIFTIRIENTGQVDILQNHYDVDDVWGFRVQNGKIIEVRLLYSNSDYLKSKLNPQLFEENVVQLKKIIFEREKFFTLEVLVLHTKDKLPEINPLGKIAGIDRTIPVKSWLEKGKQTFLTQLVHGDIDIQIARFIIYLIATIILSIVVVLSGLKIEGLVYHRKKELRTRTIKPFLKTVEEGSKSKILSDMYVKQGLESIKEIQTLLEDEDRLLIGIQEYELQKEFNKKRSELRKTKLQPGDSTLYYPDYVPLHYPDYVPFSHQLMVSKLVNKGVLTIGNDNKVLIDTEFKQALNELLRYLETKKKVDMTQPP